MKDIDWSKAPQGSTHWDPLDRNHLRQVDGSAQVWDIAAGWESNSWQYPGDLSTMSRLIARPVWDGKGLPPVGTVCEFQHRNAPNGIWQPTTIRYSSHAFIVYVDSVHGVEECWRVNDSCAIDFRPARTAEQIAADERAAAIEEIRQLLLSGAKGSIESVIYDAGYRKQVQP